MAKNAPIIALSVIIGILFVIVAGVYFMKTADQLPSFFPGYDAAIATKHIKHGIGAFLLGVACFVFAWFQSGPKSSSGEIRQ
jgi:hypothetical protein